MGLKALILEGLSTLQGGFSSGIESGNAGEEVTAPTGTASLTEETQPSSSAITLPAAAVPASETKELVSSIAGERETESCVTAATTIAIEGSGEGRENPDNNPVGPWV